MTLRVVDIFAEKRNSVFLYPGVRDGGGVGRGCGGGIYAAVIIM